MLVSGKWLEFKTFGERDLCAMRDAAMRFVADFKVDKPARWLSLLGTSGAGKTMLANLVRDETKQWWSSETRGRYATRWPLFHWPTICERMFGGEWDLKDHISEQHACVIDEIGADSDDPRKLKADKLCKIAEQRLGKWTVFTSNLTLDGIAKHIDQRIASRLLRGGSEVVCVDAIDFNLRTMG